MSLCNALEEKLNEKEETEEQLDGEVVNAIGKKGRKSNNYYLDNSLPIG